MKQMGRTHRPFYRICAMDKRAPRDGKVLEELGIYDPMVRDTDARVQLDCERVDYWLSVGAQPSEKVAVLLKKYGTNGSHVDANKAAIEKLAQPLVVPERGAPVVKQKTQEEIEAEEAAAAAEAAKAEEGPGEESAEAPAEEKPEEQAAE
ncbi:30S ribosomal protein S16 [Aeoliella mucimassa]|nr:30S ribosomal protein S16 [Aeoliella mucimassa]